MKLDLIQPQTGIPSAAPYPNASMAAFAAPAEVVAQGGAKLAQISESHLGAIRRAEEAKKLVQIHQDAAEIKSQAEVELAQALSSLTTERDPDTHAAKYAEIVAQIRASIPMRTRYPETKALLDREMPSVFSRYDIQAGKRKDVLFIDARKASMRTTIDNNTRLGADAPLGPDGDIEFADRYQDNLKAIRLAEPVIGADEAEKWREKVAHSMYGLRAEKQAHADPQEFLNKLAAGHYRGMKEEQAVRLQGRAESTIISRANQAEAERKRVFGEQSGLILKDLIGRARTGEDVQDAALDNAAVLSPEHFREALSINDSLKKARNVGSTDEKTLTQVRELINTRRIRTPEGLNAYRGQLSEPDYQRQLDRVYELARQEESDRRSAETESRVARTENRVLANEARHETQRKEDNAIRVGREYIMNSTQVGPQLITFDSDAQLVRAEQVNRFETEARGKTPSEIDQLSKLRVAEARVALFDKLKIKGQQIYPLLGKYQTREQVADAQKRGEIDRQTSDNMINLIDYLDKISGAETSKGEQRLGEAVGEGLKKKKESGLGVLKRAITGGEAPTPAIPNPQEIGPLSIRAAKELYPDLQPNQVILDDAKVEAVRKRVMENYQKGQRKP